LSSQRITMKTKHLKRLKLKNIRRVFLLGVFSTVYLWGCATIYNPATERNEFIFIDSQTEYAVGKNVVPELLRKHPLCNDPVLKARLTSIGGRIAVVSDRKDIEYNFSVLEDKELNALTLPGGWIYVNRGLMEAFNDDELAYVVAHEVGHVAARHIVKKMQASMAYELILGAALSGAGRRNTNSAKQIAIGVDAVYNLLSLSYSRRDEYEADKLAVKYMQKAGFKARASITALEKLKRQEDTQAGILKYFRTHPYPDDRINFLRKIFPEIDNS